MPNDLGPLPEEHPRERVYNVAKAELGALLGEFRTKHGLTSAEYIQLMLDNLEFYTRILMAKERKGNNAMS